VLDPSAAALPVPAAVCLSVLPGALGANLLRAFLARSPVPPLSDFRLDAALADVCPARAHDVLVRATAAAAPLLDDLAAGRRRAIRFGEPAYPAALAAIADPPPLLWINGGAGVLAHPVIAVVGSRYASPSSLDVAFALARDLAARGVVIASGLARGVDEAAHRGALEAGGLTVAVLGCGLDRVYPPEHGALADVIVETGAIVSELPPSAPPAQEHFPRRNRIISGLSLGVVIVEASLRSGSLITARCAADQGREVMAVPGTALGQRHKGSHSLIRDGAALVECADDVFAALGGVNSQLPTSNAQGTPTAQLQSNAQVDAVLAALDGVDAATVETLALATGLPASELLSRLGLHEVAGRVTRLPGGAFRAARTAVVR
jgi:DNA processing protein